jgi:hypothetical protein
MTVLEQGLYFIPGRAESVAAIEKSLDVQFVNIGVLIPIQVFHSLRAIDERGFYLVDFCFFMVPSHRK